MVIRFLKRNQIQKFLLELQDGLNVSPEYSVVFEDAIAGVEAANRAGMYSIGVGDTETLQHAKYVVKDFHRVNASIFRSIN
jgi:beta-phosphoglucomutase